MKPTPAFHEAGDDPHSAGPSPSAPAAHPTGLHSHAAAVPALTCPHQLSNAIDVVGLLTEQAWRNSKKGACELAMFEAFNATFAYMVEYLDHLTIDQLDPSDALAKAATTAKELTREEREFLRAVCLRRNSGG